MLLNSKQIRENCLIFNSLECNFRATSYDLRVGTIIDTNGKEHSQYHVKSSSIIEVISEETVCLDSKTTGFAHVKTSLSCEGLLALNIGIIDPGWEGPISTTLVNFGGDKSHLIQKGDLFLRITFIRSEVPEELVVPQVRTRENYKRTIKGSFSKNFDSDFLSLDTHIEKRIRGSQKKTMESKMTIFGLAFIAIQIGLGYFFYMDPLALNKSYTAAADIRELETKQELILEELRKGSSGDN